MEMNDFLIELNVKLNFNVDNSRRQLRSEFDENANGLTTVLHATLLDARQIDRIYLLRNIKWKKSIILILEISNLP